MCLAAAMAYLKPVRGQAPTAFPEYAHQEDVKTLALSQNNFTRDLYVVSFGIIILLSLLISAAATDPSMHVEASIPSPHCLSYCQINTNTVHFTEGVY